MGPKVTIIYSLDISVTKFQIDRLNQQGSEVQISKVTLFPQLPRSTLHIMYIHCNFSQGGCSPMK